MARILGIDCSSQTIGYCLIETNNDEIKYITSGVHKPQKKGTISEKLAFTRNFFKTLFVDLKPDIIAIEEIIQFMKGKSTAKTIIMLTAFNRMLCLSAFDFLNKNPELHSVMSIRHGIKETKVLPKKEEIPKLVASRLNIEFPFILNKKGHIAVESYDRADGIAVALYQAMISTNKLKKKTKAKKQTTKKVKNEQSGSLQDT